MLQIGCAIVYVHPAKLHFCRNTCVDQFLSLQGCDFKNIDSIQDGYHTFYGIGSDQRFALLSAMFLISQPNLQNTAALVLRVSLEVPSSSSAHSRRSQVSSSTVSPSLLPVTNSDPVQDGVTTLRVASVVAPA
jgi:hypothetical protein